MGSSYHQFCPVAKAMELLDERWTLLVIRELLSGSRHFNEVRRGVPRMSPTLLSKRLNQLVRAGLVHRREKGDQVHYELTQAGLELRPIVEALGAWGVRWIGDLGDQDFDPKLLLWDMRRNVDHAATPPGRTVVLFRFADVPAKARHWWLVIAQGDADVCDFDPGHEITITVDANLRGMVRVWRGDLPWADALRQGDLTVQGPQDLRRTVPTWFTLPFAAVPRVDQGDQLTAPTALD